MKVWFAFTIVMFCLITSPVFLLYAGSTGESQEAIKVAMVYFTVTVLVTFIYYRLDQRQMLQKRS